MEDVQGWKTTELWLTTVAGIINAILGATAPTQVTTSLIVCITVMVVIYTICRTVFKVVKLIYRPNEIVNFSVHKRDSE